MKSYFVDVSKIISMLDHEGRVFVSLLKICDITCFHVVPFSKVGSFNCLSCLLIHGIFNDVYKGAKYCSMLFKTGIDFGINLWS